MIKLGPADLRKLADALDRMALIEQETGILIEGHGGNTLTTTTADTVKFSRVIEGDAELVSYVVEFEQ